MLSWTPPQRPLSISLASNYAMPHHHALAAALTPQRFAKNSALKMLFFLILLGPSSLPLSDQVCWAKWRPAFPVWKASCHWSYYPLLSLHDLGSSSSLWVPTKAVPSHRRPLQWFLWVGTADKHSIHHHSHAHQSPLCLPRHASKLFNRQWPESQRSLITTNFTRK